MNDQFVDEAANLMKELPTLLLDELKELFDAGDVNISREDGRHTARTIMADALANLAKKLGLLLIEWVENVLNPEVMS